MRIDDRLDLFRVHLETPDIDDPATTAHEVIATGTRLDAIPGIHEAIGAAQGFRAFAEVALRRPGRADLQGVLHHAQLGARAAGAHE